MIRFRIAGLYTGRYEGGIVTMDGSSLNALTLQLNLQAEVDQRRELATGYTPGPDEYMRATLQGWPHETLEDTPPAIAPGNAVN
jgi:hypothetical protein